MNKYVGNPLQLYGVEELRLCGGRGDGMRMLCVRNGRGLEFWISADRCADISRLTFGGDNYGYFSPCGYVAPQYYDGEGSGFLKSFTAGFITTCGLTAVGSPCTDNGEELPLHGTISNTPCDNIGHWIAEDGIHIKALIRDARMFSHKLVLEREYIVPLDRDEIIMIDNVTNTGASETPFELLYHCNMGYPLLNENTELTIPSTEVTPRNDHAVDGIATCLEVEKPQKDYEEMCFYHKLDGVAEITVYNPDISKGVKMIYSTDELPCFTQWKQMGEYDYVMGLEPGNCFPDGRDAMRRKGLLQFLSEGESRSQSLRFKFFKR